MLFSSVNDVFLFWQILSWICSSYNKSYVSKKDVKLFTVLMQGWKCVQAPNFTMFYISSINIDKVRKHITAHSGMFIIFILRTSKFTEMWCVWFVCVTPLPLHTFATNEHIGSYNQKLSHFQQELNVLKNFCKAPLSNFIKISDTLLSN